MVNNNRTVHKQLSIFDVLNFSSLEFPDKKAIRVMYEYNGVDRKEAFTVLNRDIPRETAQSIIAWLETNMTTDDLIYGLDSNGIDFGSNGRSRSKNLNS